MADKPICTVFGLIADLAGARGIRNIKDTPGLTSMAIDERWSVDVNPHPEELGGTPPFHALIWYNGWPAGVVGPYEGTIAAGDTANEEALIAALKTAIQTSKEQKEDGHE